VDDNSPVFSQPAYHVTLAENSPVGMVILNISVSYTQANTHTHTHTHCTCIFNTSDTAR